MTVSNQIFIPATDSLPSTSTVSNSTAALAPIPGSTLSPGLDGTVEIASGSVLGPGLDAPVEALPGSTLSPGWDAPVVFFETNTCPEIEAGTFGRTPPQNFIVLSASAIQVVVQWDVVSDADLKQDELVVSLHDDVIAAAPGAAPGGAPAQVLAHKRTVIGYKLHKGLPGFFPDGTAEGEGNVIADFSTLGPGATQFVDTSVVPGSTVAYKLATQIDDGF